MCRYMTFFRQRSTPVSTVSQKLVRFFIINIPVFLILKLKSGKWFGQWVNILSEWLRNPGKGLWGVTIQKISWGSMPLDPPWSLRLCSFRELVSIYSRSAAIFHDELVFLSFLKYCKSPLTNKPSLLRGRKLIRPPTPFLRSPSPPSYYYSLTNGRHFWSITAVKLSVDWSRMVHSPAGSLDLFLIPSCMTFNFLYLSFSTFYGELILPSLLN